VVADSAGYLHEEFCTCFLIWLRYPRLAPGTAGIRVLPHCDYLHAGRRYRISGFIFCRHIIYHWRIRESVRLIGALLYYGKSRGGIFGQSLFKQLSGWVIGIGLFGLLVPGINNWAMAVDLPAASCWDFYSATAKEPVKPIFITACHHLYSDYRRNPSLGNAFNLLLSLLCGAMITHKHNESLPSFAAITSRKSLP